MPSLGEQLFSLAIIALAMVFGAFIYRRHAARIERDKHAATNQKKRTRKSRPRKKS